ncbi:hypothetical protein F2P81_024232 [Scophthalmus maximus]|uniref:Osteopetrosis-associated transmembrane protein 1 n=1 Tax=Scophthalmus maximus TaxID=52904 RepID=A0A6A4RWU7_SCOMX|nr:hypothetical protein F2P81_024232 [Scophthalmus maximus]
MRGQTSSNPQTDTAGVELRQETVVSSVERMTTGFNIEESRKIRTLKFSDAYKFQLKSCSFCVLLVTHLYPLVATDPAADGVKSGSPVFVAAAGPSSSVRLLSSFPDDLEISDYCNELLHVFGQRYVAYVNCLVPAARPVRVCQNCFSSYGSLVDTYTNISSDQMGPGNVSCRDSLLRSDRLMLVFLLYSNLKGLWDKSGCDPKRAKSYTSLMNIQDKLSSAAET